MGNVMCNKGSGRMATSEILDESKKHANKNKTQHQPQQMKRALTQGEERGQLLGASEGCVLSVHRSCIRTRQQEHIHLAWKEKTTMEKVMSKEEKRFKFTSSIKPPYYRLQIKKKKKKIHRWE